MRIRLSTLAILSAATLLTGAACDAGPAGAGPTAPAVAAQRAPLPPAAARLVSAWRAEILEDACSGPGFEAVGAPSIDHTADFNDDGRPDYVIGVGGLTCRFDGAPMAALFSPSVPGGLILSSPDGYRLEHFQSSEIRKPEMREFDGRPVLVLFDGGPGAFARPFDSHAWGWTGNAMGDLAFYDDHDRKVNPDGSPWRGPAQAAPHTGAHSRFLPLPIGYYAPDGDCGTDPFNLQYLAEDGIRFSDLATAACRFVRTRSLGGHRYETTESCLSEEGGEAPRIDVWRVGPDGYAYDAPDVPGFRHCPIERVPARSRFVR
ncbi:hypothetical protein ACFPIF_12465 [Brevundimonas faecalis]|uniref:hypothetical protein n=1 Tax=Brevundimonas faecalis TaxID=947378 RepID=UPI003616618A